MRHKEKELPKEYPARRIRELVDADHVTYQALADLLFVNISTAFGYVNGLRRPQYETLIKMADYFDTTTDFLLGRTDKR